MLQVNHKEWFVAVPGLTRPAEWWRERARGTDGKSCPAGCGSVALTAYRPLFWYSSAARSASARASS